jgi:hypothetical protein
MNGVLRVLVMSISDDTELEKIGIGVGEKIGIGVGVVSKYSRNRLTFAERIG